MGKDVALLLIGIGVEIAITFVLVVVKEMPLPLAMIGIIVGICFIGAGIIGLVRTKTRIVEKSMPSSNKQPILLIPKRKIKRIVHREETIDGKTKDTKEIELDP